MTMANAQTSERRKDEPVILIDAWLDFVCPFCYMGERKLQAGIALDGGVVQINYRSFNLVPDIPVGYEGSPAAYLSKVRGFPQGQVREMFEGLTQQAAPCGVDFRFDTAKMSNTRKAHELLHFAKSKGRQGQMQARLFKAYFTDGLNLGRDEDLASLAADVGLDQAAAIRALEEEAFLADVQADFAQAHAMGIRSVPHFLIDGATAISGGQEPEVFRQALVAARNRRLESGPTVGE